jgi:hypothetical protein
VDAIPLGDRQLVGLPGKDQLALALLLAMPLGVGRNRVRGTVTEADRERPALRIGQAHEVLGHVRPPRLVELIAEQLPGAQPAAPARELGAHAVLLEDEDLLGTALARRGLARRGLARLCPGGRGRPALSRRRGLGGRRALVSLLWLRLLGRKQKIPRQHDREGDNHREHQALALIFHLCALSRRWRRVDRIVAACEKRIAAEKTPQRLRHADQQAAPLDRLDAVLRTGGQVAAGRHPLER